MHYNRILSLALLCITWLMAGSPVSAQQDQWISDNPTTSVLADESRIQMAARIGERTLVVWGTSVVDGDRIGKPVLMFQFVEGDRRLGSPSLLLDTVARPVWIARLVALSESYLLIWNDRRSDAPGLYSQRLDTAGRPIGQSQRITDYLASERDLFIGGTVERGLLVCWNAFISRKRYAYIARLDPSGVLVDGPTLLDSQYVYTANRYESLPGYSFLVVDFDMRAWLVLPDGTLDSRPIPERTFTLPSLVEHDFSILFAVDSTLQRYRTLWDTVVERSIHIPGLNQAMVGTATITRRADGQLSVRWMTLVTGYKSPRFIAHETLVDPGWTMARAAGSDTLELDVNRLCHITQKQSVTHWSTWRYPRCEGVTDLVVRIKFECLPVGDNWQQSITYRATPDSGRFNPAEIGPGIECPPYAAVDVRRTAYDTISSVTLQTSSGALALSAGVVPRKVIHHHDAPAISVRNGKLIVAWERRASRTASWMLAMQGEWDGSSRPAIDHTSYRAPDMEKYPHYGPDVWTGGYSSIVNDTVICTEGVSFYSGLRARFDGYRTYRPSGEAPPSWTEGRRFDLHVATPGGWKLILSHHDYGPHLLFGLESASYDARTGQGVVTVIKGSPGYATERWLIEFNEQGEVARVTPGFLKSFPELRILATGSGRQIAIADTTAIECRYGVEQRRFEILPAREHSDISLLSNGRFLRYQRPEHTVDSLLLEIYSLAGKRLAWHSVPKSSAQKMALAESPSDGTIAIVTSGNEGVSASFFDGTTLLPARMEVPISARRDTTGDVSAVYRGDSLFVLWEDNRTGAMTIYGRAWNSGSASTGPDIPIFDTSRETAMQLQIYPNPASASFLLGFELASPSKVSVAICSIDGRIVRRFDLGTFQSGRHASPLMLDGISPGSYIVRLDSEPGGSTAKLVVIQPR